MTTDVTVRTGTAPARAEPMPIIQRAGRVLLAAGAFGVVGQVLFFGVGLGINFPIAIGLLLAGGWLIRRPAARTDWRDLWLGPAAMALAAFAAIRADPPIVALDVLTAIGLAVAALASFSGRSVTPRPVVALISMGLGLIAWVAGGAVFVVSSARRHLPPARWNRAARRARRSRAARAPHRHPDRHRVRGAVLRRGCGLRQAGERRARDRARSRRCRVAAGPRGGPCVARGRCARDCGL